jgi:hypothetical protein
MKQIKSFALLLFVLVACAPEEPEVAKAMKLATEEHFMADAASAEGFTPLLKKTHHYDQNKLIKTDMHEYNELTHAYEPGRPSEEYAYTNDGKLSRQVKYIGTTRRLREYEYPSATSIKVTSYRLSEYTDTKNLEDWWIIERVSSSLLTIKYYQLENELYSQLTYEIDGNGNVISLTRIPSLPVGKVYFKYDNAPNPFRFLELAGEHSFSSSEYFSTNNVVESTNDSNTKSIRKIEYSENGYPITVITSTSKSIYTYQ